MFTYRRNQWETPKATTTAPPEAHKKVIDQFVQAPLSTVPSLARAVTNDVELFRQHGAPQRTPWTPVVVRIEEFLASMSHVEVKSHDGTAQLRIPHITGLKSDIIAVLRLASLVLGPYKRRRRTTPLPPTPTLYDMINAEDVDIVVEAVPVVGALGTRNDVVPDPSVFGVQNGLLSLASAWTNVPSAESVIANNTIELGRFSRLTVTRTTQQDTKAPDEMFVGELDCMKLLADSCQPGTSLADTFAKVATTLPVSYIHPLWTRLRLLAAVADRERQHGWMQWCRARVQSLSALHSVRKDTRFGEVTRDACGDFFRDLPFLAVVSSANTPFSTLYNTKNPIMVGFLADVALMWTWGIMTELRIAPPPLAAPGGVLSDMFDILPHVVAAPPSPKCELHEKNFWDAIFTVAGALISSYGVAMRTTASAVASLLTQLLQRKEMAQTPLVSRCIAILLAAGEGREEYYRDDGNRRAQLTTNAMDAGLMENIVSLLITAVAPALPTIRAPPADVDCDPGQHRAFGLVQERVVHHLLSSLCHLAQGSHHRTANPTEFLLSSRSDVDGSLCTVVHDMLKAPAVVGPMLFGTCCQLFASCIHDNVRDVVPGLLERNVLETAVSAAVNPALDPHAIIHLPALLSAFSLHSSAAPKITPEVVIAMPKAFLEKENDVSTDLVAAFGRDLFGLPRSATEGAPLREALIDFVLESLVAVRSSLQAAERPPCVQKRATTLIAFVTGIGKVSGHTAANVEARLFASKGCGDVVLDIFFSMVELQYPTDTLRSAFQVLRSMERTDFNKVWSRMSTRLKDDVSATAAKLKDGGDDMKAVVRMVVQLNAYLTVVTQMRDTTTHSRRFDHVVQQARDAVLPHFITAYCELQALNLPTPSPLPTTPESSTIPQFLLAVERLLEETTRFRRMPFDMLMGGDGRHDHMMYDDIAHRMSPESLGQTIDPLLKAAQLKSVDGAKDPAAGELALRRMNVVVRLLTGDPTSASSLGTAYAQTGSVDIPAELKNVVGAAEEEWATLSQEDGGAAKAENTTLRKLLRAYCVLLKALSGPGRGSRLSRGRKNPFDVVAEGLLTVFGFSQWHQLGDDAVCALLDAVINATREQSNVSAMSPFRRHSHQRFHFSGSPPRPVLGSPTTPRSDSAGAPPRAESSSPTGNYDPHNVDLFVGIGFTPAQAAHALRHNDGDVSRAMDWILQHSSELPTDEIGVDAPPAEPKKEEPPAPPKPPLEILVENAIAYAAKAAVNNKSGGVERVAARLLHTVGATMDQPGDHRSSRGDGSPPTTATATQGKPFVLRHFMSQFLANPTENGRCLRQVAIMLHQSSMTNVRSALCSDTGLVDAVVKALELSLDNVAVVEQLVGFLLALGTHGLFLDDARPHCEFFSRGFCWNGERCTAPHIQSGQLRTLTEDERKMVEAVGKACEEEGFPSPAPTTSTHTTADPAFMRRGSTFIPATALERISRVLLAMVKDTPSTQIGSDVEVTPTPNVAVMIGVVVAADYGCATTWRTTIEIPKLFNIVVQHAPKPNLFGTILHAYLNEPEHSAWLVYTAMRREVHRIVTDDKDGKVHIMEESKAKDAKDGKEPGPPTPMGSPVHEPADVDEGERHEGECHEATAPTGQRPIVDFDMFVSGLDTTRAAAPGPFQNAFRQFCTLVQKDDRLYVRLGDAKLPSSASRLMKSVAEEIVTALDNLMAPRNLHDAKSLSPEQTLILRNDMRCIVMALEEIVSFPQAVTACLRVPATGGVSCVGRLIEKVLPHSEMLQAKVERVLSAAASRQPAKLIGELVNSLSVAGRGSGHISKLCDTLSSIAKTVPRKPKLVEELTSPNVTRLLASILANLDVSDPLLHSAITSLLRFVELHTSPGLRNVASCGTAAEVHRENTSFGERESIIHHHAAHEAMMAEPDAPEDLEEDIEEETDEETEEGEEGDFGLAGGAAGGAVGGAVNAAAQQFDDDVYIEYGDEEGEEEEYEGDDYYEGDVDGGYHHDPLDGPMAVVDIGHGGRLSDQVVDAPPWMRTPSPQIRGNAQDIFAELIANPHTLDRLGVLDEERLLRELRFARNPHGSRISVQRRTTQLESVRSALIQSATDDSRLVQYVAPTQPSPAAAPAVPAPEASTPVAGSAPRGARTTDASPQELDVSPVGNASPMTRSDAEQQVLALFGAAPPPPVAPAPATATSAAAGAVAPAPPAPPSNNDQSLLDAINASLAAAAAAPPAPPRHADPTDLGAPPQAPSPAEAAPVPAAPAPAEATPAVTDAAPATPTNADVSDGPVPWQDAIDPTFLAELPPDLRRDILREHFPLIVTPQAREVEGQQTNIHPLFMAAVPGDMQQELMALENELRPRAEPAAGEGDAAPPQPTEMDTATILATLPPDLREEILLTCDMSELSGNPVLEAEARSLRERQRAEQEAAAARMMPRAMQQMARPDRPSNMFDRRLYGEPARMVPQGRKIPEPKHDDLHMATPLLPDDMIVNILRCCFTGNDRMIEAICANICREPKTAHFVTSTLLHLAGSPMDSISRGMARSVQPVHLRIDGGDGEAKVPSMVVARMLDLVRSGIEHSYHTATVLYRPAPEAFTTAAPTPADNALLQSAAIVKLFRVVASSPVKEVHDTFALLLARLMKSMAANTKEIEAKDFEEIAEQSQGTQHHRHHHKLEWYDAVRLNPQYGTGKYVCDACAGTYGTLTYHCKKCQFDLCPHCFHDNVTAAESKVRVQRFLCAIAEDTDFAAAALEILLHKRCTDACATAVTDFLCVMYSAVKNSSEEGSISKLHRVFVNALDGLASETMESIGKSLKLFAKMKEASATEASLAHKLKCLQLDLPGDGKRLQRLISVVVRGSNCPPVTPPPRNPALTRLWHATSMYLTEVSAILSQSRARGDVSLPLAVLPLVEAFSVFHLTPLGDEATASIDRTDTELLLADTSDRESEVSHKACALLKHTTKAPVVPLPPAVTKFSEANKSVLNALLHMNPHLLQTSLNFLTRSPRLIDFEFKLQYFRSRLPHHHHTTLSINVTRENHLAESFMFLRGKNVEELKGQLHVKFNDEEGADAGGLTREWFQLLAEDFVNSGFGLFIHSCEGMTFQPNPNSAVNPDHLAYFRFVGRVVAMSVFHQIGMDVHFTRSLYRHMVGVEPTLRDIASIDPDLAQNMEKLLKIDMDEIDLGLDFCCTTDRFGEMIETELIEGGKDVPVTNANKKEYVRQYCAMRMTKMIEAQLQEILCGFYEVIPREFISIFTENEVELLIAGMPEVNVEDLRANTEYCGYSASSPQIRWFWEVVGQMTKEDKANLLQFATGCSKVPPDGFHNLEGWSGKTKFSIAKVDVSTMLLPVAHTCFNRIDLPEYPSAEVLKEKLAIALKFGSKGFAIV